MRKVLFFFAITLASMAAMAQTTNIPYNLHFTAVARNPTTHNPVTSQVNVQLQVYHSSSSGSFIPDTIEYCEQINGIVPNAFGEFSVTFGTSSALLCSPELALTNTQWNHGNMWYVLQYDTLGGSLAPIDTGRFSSSTYSFAAHSAEQLVNVGTPPATGSTLTWNGSAWVAGGPWSDYVFAEEVSSNVDAGRNIVGINKRNINTVVSSAGTAISVDTVNNDITLSTPGTYYIKASAPAFGINIYNQLFIQDYSSGATYINGTSNMTSTGSISSESVSEAEGFIVVSTSPVTIVLNHSFSTSTSSGGLGLSTSSNNVFAKVLVQKIK